MISGEEVLELLPALAAREPTSGYLFYDCQTDDVRLVLTVLGEAERFGAVCANRVDVIGLLEQDGRAHGVRARRRRERRAASRCAPRTWSTRPACGPMSCARRSCTTRPSCRASGPVAAPTSRCATTTLPLVGGAIVPAGAGRTIFALPWLGHTLVGTTDNDYEGPLDHVKPVGRGHRLPAGGHQRVLRLRASARRPDRRLRGRAPADLDRRSEEVGRHLAQGRAVRDLLRHDHDHRRQAHDLAADGEDDRRPPRRARRPRRALPHARNPARPGHRRRGAAARGGRARRVLSRARLPLRLRRPRGARAGGRARRAGPADRARPAGPARRGRAGGAARAGAQHRRRAAAAHPPGAARRRASWSARRLRWPVRAARSSASATSSRGSSAGAQSGAALELRRFAEEAGAEGISPVPPRRRPWGRPARRPPHRRRERSLLSPPRRRSRARAGRPPAADGHRQRLAGLLQRRLPPRHVRGAGRAGGRAARGGSRHRRHRRGVRQHRSPAARRAQEEIERVVPLVERVAGSSGRSSRSTPTSPRSRAPRSPPGPGSSTTSAACATRRWPSCARRRAPRSS